jgi:hypothetical protein
VFGALRELWESDFLLLDATSRVPGTLQVIHVSKPPEIHPHGQI